MAKRPKIDDDAFPRISPRVTVEARERLNALCVIRKSMEPRGCPQGQILIELIHKHLRGKTPTPYPVAAWHEDNKFPRINVRLTRETLELLNAACAAREALEPRDCPQGVILTELIMRYLDPAPDIATAKASVPMPKRKRVSAVRRPAGGGLRATA